MVQKSDIGPGRVAIVLPSDPRYLKVVRAVIREMGDIGGWSDQDVQAVTLAVDEACTNIIKHGYKGAEDRPIKICIQTGKDAVRIELFDEGVPVDPQKVKPRDLDEIRPGGLGVHLIRNLMDEVTFDTDYPEGNHLILVRRKSSSHGRKA